MSPKQTQPTTPAQRLRSKHIATPWTLVFLAVPAMLAAACGSERPHMGTVPGASSSNQESAGQSNTPVQEPTGQTPPEADSDATASDQQLYLADEIIAATDQKELAELDDFSFLVQGLRASLMESPAGLIPVVSFLPVDAADFYQVLRCDSGASIHAPGAAALNPLDAGIGSFIEPTRGLQETADWESLKSLGGCSLIHTSLARTAFIDNDAGTGSIKYIVRSCSLATKQVSAGGETCARLLSVSSSVAAKRTIADAVKGAVRSEIASMQSALDQAAVALATTTRNYARNVIECERAGRKENLSRHRKDLLLAVLGVGARIGAEVLSSGGTSPLTAIKSMWQDKQALARETRPIVDVLRDVFETEKQNIAQCIAAESTASQAKELVQEVQERSEAILKLAATLSSASREILR